MLWPPSAPIGVFDSGIGGLSALLALRAELPGERFVYLADSAHAPYGERGDAYVCRRSLAAAEHLIEHHHIKALVLACNTATAAAIDGLRQRFPSLPIVGMEPALKPAVTHTRSKRVGVLATRGTLQSARFAQLLGAMPVGIDWVLQPCDGLAHAIERCTNDTSAEREVLALCARYTQALGHFGTSPEDIDTVVLGCTHYVFAADSLRTLLGPDVALIDTGEPVARQTRRLLAAAGQLADLPDAPAEVQLLTTGDLGALQAAAARWLMLPPQACSHVPLSG